MNSEKVAMMGNGPVQNDFELKDISRKAEASINCTIPY
jgi:hypothetical protein